MQARLLLMYMSIFYTQLQGYKLCVSSFTVHFTKSCRIKNIMQSNEPICKRERVREGERVCVCQRKENGVTVEYVQLEANYRSCSWTFFFFILLVCSPGLVASSKNHLLCSFFSFFNTHLNGGFCYLIRTRYWIDSFGKFLILLLLKNRFWSCF